MSRRDDPRLFITGRAMRAEPSARMDGRSRGAGWRRARGWRARNPSLCLFVIVVLNNSIMQHKTLSKTQNNTSHALLRGRGWPRRRIARAGRLRRQCDFDGAQLGDDRLKRWPLLRVLRPAARDEAEQPHRSLRRHWQPQALHRNLCRDRRRRHAIEGYTCGKQLPADDSKRPEVALVRIALTEQDLWRGPLDRSDARRRARLKALA